MLQLPMLRYVSKSMRPIVERYIYYIYIYTIALMAVSIAVLSNLCFMVIDVE